MVSGRREVWGTPKIKGFHKLHIQFSEFWAETSWCCGVVGVQTPYQAKSTSQIVFQQHWYQMGCTLMIYQRNSLYLSKTSTNSPLSSSDCVFGSLQLSSVSPSWRLAARVWPAASQKTVFGFKLGEEGKDLWQPLLQITFFSLDEALKNPSFPPPNFSSTFKFGGHVKTF